MYFYLMHNKDIYLFIYLFIIYYIVHFAIGLVILVLNLPDGQVLFFGKFKLQKDCNQSF